MRSFIVCACLLTFALPATADDLYPPPWRDQPNTTWEAWWFGNDPDANPIPADNLLNPYGQPSIDDAYFASHEWFDTWEGRQGVYNFFWRFYIDLPNVPEPNEFKEIYVQWTYYVDATDPYYYGGPPNLVVDEPGSPYVNEVSLEMQLPLESTDNGTWWYERWHIFIWPNPEFESLYVDALNDYDELFFDQIIVDTRCIPEPASLLLLGVAGVLLRRR
ncbi:MAG: PEP-CTERM sorting domain-containing protein [Phycisphaerae bacterium]|jgi:hypothetical protein